MFVALQGKRDGHRFLSQAAEAQALAALVARYDPTVSLPQLVVEDPLRALSEAAARHRSTFPGPVIGITGSCGKTSTKDLLATLLGGAPRVHTTPGNFNNHIGVPLSLLGLDAEKHKAAVIEIAMNQPGEIEALTRLADPSHALVTMVGPAHLEGVGSVAGVAQEKAALPLGRQPGGFAVFPQSCLEFESFQQIPGPMRLLRHELEPPRKSDTIDAEVISYRFGPLGSSAQGGRSLTLTLNAAEVTFAVPAVSPGMVRNFALALTLAEALGVPCETLQERMTAWQPDALRGKVRHLEGRPWYVDCYNANPASMADALAMFGETFPAGPRLFILGFMAELGPASEAWHQQAGRALNWKEGDHALLIGPRPDMGAMVQGLIEAGADSAALHLLANTAEAKALIERLPGPVFLKGSRNTGLEALLPTSDNSRNCPTRQKTQTMEGASC